MKITYISYGGLGDYEKAYFREYARQGVQLDVIIPSKIPVNKVYSPSGYLAYSSQNDEPGYRFIPVGLVKPGLIDSFNPWQLLKAMQKSKPDVIHVFNDFSSLHVTQAIICRNLLYGKKVPIVVYVLENNPYQKKPFFLEFSLNGLKFFINKLLQPVLFWYHKRNVAGITSMGPEGLDVVTSLGVTLPMETIFSGINNDNFYPKDRAACRVKAGLPADTLIAGYVGRFVPEKGVELLIEAASKVPGWHVAMVGSGTPEYMEVLQALINRVGMQGKVHFIKSVDNKDLVDYYNSFSVFVMPSQTTPFWKEQCSLALTEATFCQVPVIGSSSSAIPKQLAGYPRALIFQEDSVQDLADSIAKVPGMQEFSKEQMQQYLYEHSVEHFVAAHIAFYKKLQANV